MQSRLAGIALITLAALLWSSAGLFVRALPLDLWTMQTWRAVFGALSLLALVVARHGWRTPRAFTGLGRAGWAAVPLSAVSMLCYVAALKLTTVANVMVMYATVPFAAAAIAWLWIGEQPAPRTLAASLLALLGIVVMAGGALRPSDVAGMALSLLMTLTFAVLLVMARRHRALAVAPVNALGAALCAAACWPAAASGLPDAAHLALLALFGITTTGLAYLLFLTGGRLVPSAEAGLIGLLDVVLGPLWVWLAFREAPGTPAIAGGALVLGAVGWYLLAGAGAKEVEEREA